MHTLLVAASIPAVLAGLQSFGKRPGLLGRVWYGVCALFAVYLAAELTRMALHEIAQPPLWDFKVFWMVGQVVAGGHNLYDVASYARYAALLNPGNDAEFNTIALHIGMPYPPPAAILFYPLGFIASVQTAMAVWYAAIFAAIGVSIVALWRQFFIADGIAGLITVAVLVLALPGTALTVGFGQLNIFALLLLLMVWRQGVAARSGMWLAPLMIVRPLSAVFALYYLARRQWSAISALVATTCVLFIASLPIVGVAGFASYLHQNPTQRYPEIYFKGWESLYKIVVTLGGDYTGYFSIGGHPAFVLICALSIAAAFVVCAFAAETERTLCLSMLLSLALFLYPNTGAHYTVLLLVPLLSVWAERERFALSTPAVIAFFTIQYALLIFRDGALTSGVVFAMDAVVFALLAVRLRLRRADVPLVASLQARRAAAQLAR